MKRSHTLLAATATAFVIASCDGLKEAFTAHVDVVARAGGQELSTERLASFVGNSQIPVQSDVMRVVADLWVSYQLLGLASARGDSLNDTKTVDEAMWAQIAQAKTGKFIDSIVKAAGSADTAALEQRYLQGEVLAVQHILVMMPERGAGMSPQKQDSIKRSADAIRRRATTANFSQLVKQHSEDPGSKEANGTYVFRSPDMVPEFSTASKELQPGEISNLVQTDYGFHIIRRHLLSEVRDRVIVALSDAQGTKAQDDYLKKLGDDSKLEVRPGTAAKARAVAKEPQGMLEDKSVLVSSRRGDFTVARFAQHVLAYPPGSQLRPTLANPQMPDSNIEGIVRQFALKDLVVSEAERAKVQADTATMSQIRGLFNTMVVSAWAGLNIQPESLGDSARTQGERERLAATRVEDALDKLFATNGTQGFVDVPQPLMTALRSKYSSRINPAGLERSLERAGHLRAALDSTRAKQAPPGMPPGTPMPQPVRPPR